MSDDVQGAERLEPPPGYVSLGRAICVRVEDQHTNGMGASA